MVDGGEEFYEAVQEMATFPTFSNAISRLPDSSKEQRADEELVLRYFAVTTFRDGYKGNIEEWLDTFMEGVLFGEIKFDIASSKARFERVFSLIEQKLQSQAFTRFNGQGHATGRLAPAYFEAVVAVFDEASDELEAVSSAETLERLKSAFASEAFQEATGPGANTITKLQARIDAVKVHLLV
ncbi:hypothetical protein GCM10007921_38260 [Tritonibacter mobilis]|nr:hypothetical protein GCM10007921_38260 [Tritonibacter mobilis]